MCFLGYAGIYVQNKTGNTCRKQVLENVPQHGNSFLWGNIYSNLNMLTESCYLSGTVSHGVRNYILMPVYEKPVLNTKFFRVMGL